MSRTASRSPTAYITSEGRAKLDALRLRYLDLQRRQAEIDRLQRMIDAMPSASAAPYVDNYIAPFAAQPFRSCRVYPGAGVDCAGY